jgi:hypothetical protein
MQQPRWAQMLAATIALSSPRRVIRGGAGALALVAEGGRRHPHNGVDP